MSATMPQLWPRYSISVRLFCKPSFRGNSRLVACKSSTMKCWRLESLFSEVERWDAGIVAMKTQAWLTESSQKKPIDDGNFCVTLAYDHNRSRIFRREWSFTLCTLVQTAGRHRRRQSCHGSLSLGARQLLNG
jgi:hypothetical protein